ncbi:hypothetical protein BCT30_05840 [Enterovibrio norvegicus]|uniref:OmpA family protein n=1 Tax=Enterovibrio norvegicus TaxID=188144 RepID=UPI000C84D23C|nr:OmpA family protein [Enterovibrio norvegicus]MCC4797658.1 OmpA family protein [Enterovibrio norvegicus]PMI31319.1 hypothetical protein BCU47_16715 [Enterovibrio norvegicus]PMI35610.1 hypothetical protein BCU46_17805 [Enterovibrio norvegicus]PMN43843.1 hypothetical protein BCT30_05840 [Enterovibrio norvegicus]TKF03968.1 OmpA family protein [Enterovibrio norvegicus]
MHSLRNLLVIFTVVLIVSGCSSKPGENKIDSTTPSYTNEKLFSVYKDILNLSTEPLYLKIDGNTKLVGTKTTSHSIFKTGSSEFTDKGAAQAYFYFRGVNAKAEKTWLTVVGHTDASGNSNNNLKLSEQRSFEVASFASMAGPNLDTHYQFGDYLPEYSNNTKTGRKKNRRVDFLEFHEKEYLDFYLKKHYVAAYEKEIARRQASAQKSVKPSRENKSNNINDEAPLIKPAKRKVGQYVDFNGSSFQSHQFDTIALLEPKAESFSFFKKAVAADISESCINDTSSIVVDDRVVTSSGYFPFMNKTSWWGEVNNHGILITPVAVENDDTTVVVAPTVHVYENYKKGQKPSYTYIADAIAYEGENSILYRVYPRDSENSLQCIDLLLSKHMSSTNRQAIRGKIIYDSKQGLRVANYMPVFTN